MKRKLYLVLSLLMAMSVILTACAGGGAQDTPAATMETTEEMPATEAPGAETGNCPLSVEEGASITFSGWGDTTEQQVYRDTITRFSEACPGVTVEYLPTPDQFQDKMKSQMAAGTAPDVMYIDDQLMTAFSPSGQLLDLAPFMDEAGISRDD
jgi:ABC-type glycerol-3-phosphate transport system substrate-binding protein